MPGNGPPCPSRLSPQSGHCRRQGLPDAFAAGAPAEVGLKPFPVRFIVCFRAGGDKDETFKYMKALNPNIQTYTQSCTGPGKNLAGAPRIAGTDGNGRMEEGTGRH